MTFGELLISAWEIGSGCADMLVAWQLNLGGLAFGAMISPRKMWRAFLRGRRSRNFYRASYDATLLDQTVGDAMRKLGLTGQPTARATWRDAMAFGAAVAAGFIVGTVWVAVFAPIALFVAAPLNLVAARRRRSVA